MSVTEFAGRTDLQLSFPLSVGEVFGVRAWNVDQYGRLRSVGVTSDPWRPGVNVAKCKKSNYPGYNTVVTFPSSGYYTINGPTAWDVEYTLQPDGSVIATTRSPGSFVKPIEAPKPKVNLTKKPKHLAPVEECACGFYAYGDSHHENVRNHLSVETGIMGIIRGTGRTLIGTRGFRCEKAEIVGFLDPSRGGKKSGRVQLAERVARVYPEIPMYPSKRELFAAWQLTDLSPDTSSEDFWSLP